MKKRIKADPLDIVIFIVMALVCISVVLPFLNILAVSFSSSDAVVAGKVHLLPKGFNLDTFRKIFSHPSFMKGFLNSLIQTVSGTVLGMILTIMCAYPLSKPNLPGRKLFLNIILITMFFSGGLIPTYMLVKNLHLIDTIWAIILPFSIIPYYLLLVINFFRSVPEELEEAAMLDGLGPIGILVRIVLPVSKPILATLFVYLFVYYWNNWFNSMIYLNSSDKFPVMLIVRNIIAGAELAGGNTSGVASLSAVSLQSASIIVTTLPIMILIPFAQKFFVKGVMIGSVKG